MKSISFKFRTACLALTSVIGLHTVNALAANPQTLPSGVVVQQLTVGQGAQPSATDTVTVNYRGTLANGTEFDSSYKRGTPASFPLGAVIPCWTQALQTMKVGGKARLTCPPATAYGDRQVGPIPAGSTLTFEVELLKIGQ
jgi:FKBP-type peptidyl-prolyl cis-trans isomerase FkpA